MTWRILRPIIEWKFLRRGAFSGLVDDGSGEAPTRVLLSFEHLRNRVV